MDMIRCPGVLISGVDLYYKAYIGMGHTEKSAFQGFSGLEVFHCIALQNVSVYCTKMVQGR